jgi:hypothetical protein
MKCVGALGLLVSATVANLLRDTDLDADPHADEYRYADVDTHTDTDQHADTYRYADVDTERDAERHKHLHADADIDSATARRGLHRSGRV